MTYEVSNVAEIDSPALLIYIDRVEENIRRMIAIAGDAQRLCPHVKTHKLPQLIRTQMAMGIKKFKCATIAEAEMLARCEVPNVLLAYQPTGPKVGRLLQLIKNFPKTKFSAITDDEAIIRNLSQTASTAGTKVTLLLDIDCGMQRTGVPAGSKAFELYRLIASLPALDPGGLHVYDGHISDEDPTERERKCEAAFAPVTQLRGRLLQAGLPVPRFIVGGTPTFPIHARRKDVECSPGTCVLWDAGYSRMHDMDFLHAALVLTRVVSKPGEDRLCLDLGHKAIAAENPHPRVLFLNLPDATAVKHSEEHLVIETSQASKIPIGSVIYGVPRHVCPTVALYSEVVVVRNGCASEIWPVEARARKLSC